MWCAAGKYVRSITVHLYTVDVVCVAYSFGIRVHCYASDLQLCAHCRVNDAAAAVARLLVCVEAIDRWMSSNRLKMNPDKTQFIWLGSRQQLSTVNKTPLRQHDSTVVVPSDNVRNLGVFFDCHMTMLDHVNNVTRACLYQLGQLRCVHRSLSKESAKLLVHALISSRVDYSNSLFYGASSHFIRKMQAVMILNSAAWLICSVGRFDHIIPVIRDELHWLPVQQRIKCKIALLVYKCLHGTGPSYLSDSCTALTEANLRHRLRSVRNA